MSLKLVSEYIQAQPKSQSISPSLCYAMPCKNVASYNIARYVAPRFSFNSAYTHKISLLLCLSTPNLSLCSLIPHQIHPFVAIFSIPKIHILFQSLYTLKYSRLSVSVSSAFFFVLESHSHIHPNLVNHRILNPNPFFNFPTWHIHTM